MVRPQVPPPACCSGMPLLRGGPALLGAVVVARRPKAVRTRHLMVVLAVNGSHCAQRLQRRNFSIAASFMCLIFARGAQGGVHFNPGATTATVYPSCDKCSAKDGVIYMGVRVVRRLCCVHILSS